MVPLDRTLATSYRLSIVTTFTCSGLDAFFSGKFNAISGHISEAVRDRAKVAINHH